MSEERRSVDVTDVPSTGFGPSTLLWWGTLAFITIEGFTLLLAAASYLYLRINQFDWPPAPYAQPDLLIPTINTVLLLLLILPMHRVEKASMAYDRKGVARWLLVTTLLTVPVIVLRWFDLLALNVRWDTNAYGSAAWAVVILHGTLILVDLLETGAMTVLFYRGKAQRKHYSDAADAALYQYYLSASWIPLYLIIYWGPRIL